MQYSITRKYPNVRAYACFFVGAVFFFGYGHSFDFERIPERLQFTVSEGSIARQISFTFLGAYGIIALFVANNRRLIPTNLLGILCAAYLVWISMSLFWSPNLALSSKRLIVVYMMSVGALGLARLIDIRDLWYIVFVVSGFFLVIGIAGELVHGIFVPLSTSYRFGGTLDPNDQGVNLSLFILAGICLRKYGLNSFGKLWIGFVVAAILLLLLTKSRTAIISLSVALTSYIFFMMFAYKRFLPLALLASAILAISFLVIWVDTAVPFLGKLVSFSRPGSDIGTFSGRTDMWEIALIEIWKKPFIGFGYEGYWVDIQDIVYSLIGWNAGNPHSLYLDTLLSAGFVGLTLLMAIIFGGIIRAFIEMRQGDTNEFAGIAALLVFTLVHGIFEADLNSGSLLRFTVMTAIASLAFPQTRDILDQRSRPNTGYQWA